MPWEVLAAMDELIFEQRRAAYSATAAARFNVPWLSLVMDRDARLVVRTLKQLSREYRIPKGVFEMGSFSLVNPSAAAARYQAAIEWFDKYNHLVISNGPFLLSKYDPPAQFAELSAFRDPTYPYKPGDWYFGDPPEFEIAPVAAVEIVPGKDTAVTVQVNGPGVLGLRYIFVDPVSREVVYQAEAKQLRNSGTFTAIIPGSVTASLFPGLYQLSLVAYSEDVATVTDRIVDVDVLE